MVDLDFAEGTVYPESVVTENETTLFLARLHENHERRLCVVGQVTGFEGGVVTGDIHHFPLTSHNASKLRTRLAWLRPVPLGLRTSFGFGDRIGLATPGHIQALRSADPHHIIAPIFAQQSVRENMRTGRSPQEVMDDAMWGIFQQGWHDSWGADADHVKQTVDLPPFVAAGYTFYTIDPSDHVDSAAYTDDLDTLRRKVSALPWDRLETNMNDMRARYTIQPIQLNGLALTFNDFILLHILAKYGAALAHTAMIAEALVAHMNSAPFDLEMSVDETDTPTSPEEHFFLANELARLGIPVISLAPRFIGKFQKGVDYIGDFDEFERQLAKHVAIMKHFGTYKLGIHTGSDKFSIYPTLARHTVGRVHMKTAGTSYLEVLRVISHKDPALFRRILDTAKARFEYDRKTYYLDAELSNVPLGDTLHDSALPALLDQFDARQVLHVAFGSVLDEFGSEVCRFIAGHEASYDEALQAHFARHLTPFTLLP